MTKCERDLLLAVARAVQTNRYNHCSESIHREPSVDDALESLEAEIGYVAPDPKPLDPNEGWAF